MKLSQQMMKGKCNSWLTRQNRRCHKDPVWQIFWGPDAGKWAGNPMKKVCNDCKHSDGLAGLTFELLNENLRPFL